MKNPLPYDVALLKKLRGHLSQDAKWKEYVDSIDSLLVYLEKGGDKERFDIKACKEFAGLAREVSVLLRIIFDI